MSWLDDVVAHAQQQLTRRCREELLGRGVSPEQIEQFQLGYLNGSLPDLGCPADFVEWCRVPERIADVFVLPLTNTIGEVKGFQVRHVERAAKGFQEYSILTGEPVLFGLGQAAESMWRLEEGVLVEGVFDLLPLQRHLPHVVATLTAKVPESFVPTLRRIVRRLWLGYDMDDTGRRGVARFQKKHGGDFDLHRLAFPGVRFPNGTVAKDPGEVWEVWGDDQLRRYLAAQTWLTLP